MRSYTLRVVAVLVLLAGPTAWADEPQEDCGACHEKAPVPAGHMPVTEVSAESCFMCHQVGRDDGLFVAIHQKHLSFDCSQCHGDAADDALRQKLDGLLGR